MRQITEPQTTKPHIWKQTKRRKFNSRLFDIHNKFVVRPALELETKLNGRIFWTFHSLIVQPALTRQKKYLDRAWESL